MFSNHSNTERTKSHTSKEKQEQNEERKPRGIKHCQSKNHCNTTKHTHTHTVRHSLWLLSIPLDLEPGWTEATSVKSDACQSIHTINDKLERSIVRDLGGSTRGNDRPCVCRWHGCQRGAAWNLLNRFLIVRHVGSRSYNSVSSTFPPCDSRGNPFHGRSLFIFIRARFCSRIRKTTMTRLAVSSRNIELS